MYIYIYGKYVNIMVNQGGRMSRKSGNDRKKVCATCTIQKIYMPHICPMYHIMHLVIHKQQRNILYSTYILNMFHMYNIHVRYI